MGSAHPQSKTWGLMCSRFGARRKTNRFCAPIAIMIGADIAMRVKKVRVIMFMSGHVLATIVQETLFFHCR